MGQDKGRKNPTNITSLLNDDGIIITNQSSIVEIQLNNSQKHQKIMTPINAKINKSEIQEVKLNLSFEFINEKANSQ